jgi:2-methylcitrate dehydratase PrpD
VTAVPDSRPGAAATATVTAPHSRPPGRVLADFAAQLSIGAIPPGIRERVKDLLLDALASALGGVEDEATTTILGMTSTLMGPGSSTVIGSSPLSLAGATLVNGHLISSVSLCDVHYRSWCHLTPEVVPPALAIAGRQGSSGEELLVAIAAGCELTARIGVGLNYPAFHARGWNTSGVAGVFGAAVSAGKLLGLDGAQLTHALGLAGAQAAGSDAHRGTQTVRFLQPRAALSGLMAAELAAGGFAAMRDVLTEPVGGVYYTHSDGGTPAAALAELGERWELEDVWLTVWPLALLVRNIVNTILDLAERTDVRPEDIASVRISISPRAYELYGAMDFGSEARAKTSPRYLASVVLHDRSCDAAQFGAERRSDPSVVRFAREQVEVVSDPELDERAVCAELTLKDGQSHAHFRPVPHGDSADPLTRGEIIGKFRKVASRVLPEENIATTIELVDQLEHLPSIRPLLEALTR